MLAEEQLDVSLARVSTNFSTSSYAKLQVRGGEEQLDVSLARVSTNFSTSSCTSSCAKLQVRILTV